MVDIVFHKKRIADLSDEEYVDYYNTTDQKTLLMAILMELQK